MALSAAIESRLAEDRGHEISVACTTRRHWGHHARRRSAAIDRAKHPALFMVDISCSPPSTIVTTNGA